MSKTTPNVIKTTQISPLSPIQQTAIKGGMAATEEEKRPKIKR